MLTRGITKIHYGVHTRRKARADQVVKIKGRNTYLNYSQFKPLNPLRKPRHRGLAPFGTTLAAEKPRAVLLNSDSMKPPRFVYFHPI